MIAIRNIARKKTRSFLTVLGAAIGIMILSSLVSVSEGLETQIQSTIESFKIDLTVQSKGASSPYRSKIPYADYEALSNTDGIESVSSLVIGSIKTAWNSYFLLMGIAPVEAFSERLGILEGDMLEVGKHEILLGQAASKAAKRGLNEQLSLSDQADYVVAGIYMSGSRLLDNAAIVDIADAQRMLDRDGFVNLVFVQLEDGASLEDAVERIEDSFPGLSVMKGGDFAGQISLIQTVDTAAWVISLIALISSCIVVMNTLIMAVSERTKEIGILMAIGWSRARIMRTIIWESLIICFIGGLAGNLMALALVWGLQYVHPRGLWLWTSLSGVPRIMLISMGISLLLGLLSSLYPAFLSTRLLPAEALRHE